MDIALAGMFGPHALHELKGQCGMSQPEAHPLMPKEVAEQCTEEAR
jgi:hypothetical protein